MANQFDFEGVHGTWPPFDDSNLCFLGTLTVLLGNTVALQHTGTY